MLFIWGFPFEDIGLLPSNSSSVGLRGQQEWAYVVPHKNNIKCVGVESVSVPLEELSDEDLADTCWPLTPEWKTVEGTNTLAYLSRVWEEEKKVL